MKTDDVADQWQKEMDNIYQSCTIDVSASTSMSFMGRQRGYEVILHGTQYDELKEVSDKIVKEMTAERMSSTSIPVLRIMHRSLP